MVLNNDNEIAFCTSNMCAPSKKFLEKSCITLETIINMAEAYNIWSQKHKLNGEIQLSKGNMEMLKPNEYKKYLLNELSRRLDDICDDQICWTKQEFVKYMKKELHHELTHKTFRPIGPQGKFTWLNTVNINEVMKQYEDLYNDFKFLGAVPVDFDELPSLGICDLNFDELIKKGKTKLGIVFNLDEHYKSGSHWVAGFCDLLNHKLYYYDSYGIYPEARIRKLFMRIVDFCKKKSNKQKIIAYYNKHRHQYKNSECGVYSISFILNLLNGKSFYDIVGNDYPDDSVNICRSKYFLQKEFK